MRAMLLSYLLNKAVEQKLDSLADFLTEKRVCSDHFFLLKKSSEYLL